MRRSTRAGGVKAGLTRTEIRFRTLKLTRVGLIAYRALSDCAAKGSMFVITVVAARRLAHDAFGLFSIAVTAGWMLAVASDCGIQLHVSRLAAQDPGGSQDLLRRWLRIRIGTSAAAIGAVLVALWWMSLPVADAAAILLCTTAYIVNGLIEFLYYFCRGLGRSDVESSLTLAHRFGMLTCGVVALAWSAGVVALGAALLIAAVAALTGGLIVTFRIAIRMAPDGNRSAGVVKGGLGTAEEFVAEVLPIGIGIVLSALYFRIDLFLVSKWLGTATAGSYNAVFRLVEALRLFPAAVLAVALPSMFTAEDVRPLVSVATGVTLFAVAVSGVGVITAPWLVTFLYGSRFSDAIPAFRILLLSFPLLSLNYALTHQLLAWKGQRDYASICLIAVLANVALNSVLIPNDGMPGAAWATFWTELLLSAACGWKLYDLAPQRSTDAIPAGAGL